MRKILVPLGTSTLAFIYGYHHSEWLWFLLAFAWTPLLIAAERDYPKYLTIAAGLWVLAGASLGAENSWGILLAIAWILYILGKDFWGPQRANLAFIFLMLSAEALPFYFDLKPWDLGLYMAIPRNSNASYLEWFPKVGALATSASLLLSNLFIARIWLHFEQKRKIAWSWAIPLMLLLISPWIGNALSGLENPRPSENWPFLPMDQFMARMSFFLAFFLLLFALVRKLLPEKNADDRFT
tara:strand:+ start:1076 stop:1795 length:720 start_codon:yes stop_codon:yes gene_type:complete